MSFNDKNIKSIPDPNTMYKCLRCTESVGMTYLVKPVHDDKKYFHLNDKIDDHLSNGEKELNKKSMCDCTALMLASKNSNNESTGEILKLLLEKGVDVNLRSDSE